MATTAERSAAVLRGAEWLLQDTDAESVFTPERLTEEHRLIARTTTAFVDNEVLPNLDRLEQKDWNLARDLLKRCGGLGLLGADVPDAYGGEALDKVTSMVISEKMARAASIGLRRTGQPLRAAADALRHRGAEAEIPSEADDR
jgi:alkylation response protein AidB-like acyl-CoA dehydrogenase